MIPQFIKVHRMVATLLLGITLSLQAQTSTSGIRIVMTDTTRALSQHGITWTFKDPVRFGTYANGDFWVEGPVDIISIYPPSEKIHGRVKNGSMVNPDPELGPIHGFDSSVDVTTYRQDLNVARPNNKDLSASNPLRLGPGTTLVSSISYDLPANRPQLTDAALLTVVVSAPAEGSFRPPYCGTDKTSEFNFSQLDTSQLLTLAHVEDTPDMATVARQFQRAWIDFIPGWQQRDIHPTNNMPRYGREIAMHVGIGALMLNLDFTLAEKRKLLVGYIQLGIDLWGIVEDGGTENWAPDGGISSGRKWPILFAGMLLDDDDMRNVGPGDGTGSVYFGEDAQTFYVDQDAIDITNSPQWVVDPRTTDPQPYYFVHSASRNGLPGMPEWGIRHATQPQLDDASWLSAYRNGSTATAWSGYILIAQLMGARGLWNHEPLFEYQNRYMAISAGNPEPNGYPPVNQQPTEYTVWRTNDDFTENMWDQYWP